MAMSAANRRRSIAEINVTPLADVIIVLLIISMVTVPRLSGPVRTLPSSDQARDRQGPIEVSITAGGTVWLGAEALDVPSTLLPRLQELLSKRARNEVLVVKAEEALPYAAGQEVLRLCRDAGAEEVVLAARPRTPL